MNENLMITATQNEQTLRRFIAEFINGGDESVLADLVHEDYIYRAPGEEVKGHVELAAMFRAYRSAFPDLELKVHDIIAKDDTTVLDFELGGTHRGEFKGIPPTARPFNVRGVVISRYREGRIAEEWEILDTMTLLHQLGVA